MKPSQDAQGSAKPTPPKKQRRAIITSALPYANGEIHLGHVASTYLPADVTCRYLRLAGAEAYYVCASDDFGTPILIQSEKEGLTPQEYVARWNRRDAEDFASFGIKFDIFSQTSSRRNIEFVQDVFARLDGAGHIFEQDIVQFYCEHDSKFLPDRYVKGTCPYCGARDQYSDLCESCGRVPEEISDPRCAMCGAAPTKKRSRHYFFRLSSFASRLSEWLDANKRLQPDVKRYVQNWIESGLSEWDITRDIPWGVPVPGHGPAASDGSENTTKVFYGWFDNHLAYISAASELLESRGIDAKNFWNSADIYHFIGKDIVYHHYLFLPAMRLGIDSEYKLPDYIPTRGHLTLQSKKISKSRNWYIGLREFLQHYPADYLRYYLVAINPYSQDDLNFDWDEFAARINSELIGNLGNLVNRVLGFTSKRYGGVVPEPGRFDASDDEAASRIAGLAAEAGALMEQNHLDRALKCMMTFSSHFNQYFQHKEPWKSAPLEGAEAAGDDASTRTCLYLSINAIRSLAVAMHPFIPESAGRVWEQLGMRGSPEDHTWDGISDLLIGAGHRLGAVSPLFERIDDDEIGLRKGQLGRFDADDADDNNRT